MCIVPHAPHVLNGNIPGQDRIEVITKPLRLFQRTFRVEMSHITSRMHPRIRPSRTDHSRRNP